MPPHPHDVAAPAVYSFAAADLPAPVAQKISRSSQTFSFSLAVFSFIAAVILVCQSPANAHEASFVSRGVARHAPVAAVVHPKVSWKGAEGAEPLEPLDSTPGGLAARAPFSLPLLTVNNTAYSMIAIGSYQYHLSSLITVHSIRRFDPDRAIVIHTTPQDLPPSDIVAAMSAMGARYNVVTADDIKSVGDPLYDKCGMFYSCWLKFFVWSMTEYAMVLNVDTDYLFVKSQVDAFTHFGARATSPYDVAGVPDLVVAFSHSDSSTADVFNGGWFMALPSENAFRRMITYALGDSKWKWGEMLTLNSFPAAHGGLWHRMPVGYNTFPLLLNSGAPFYTYNGPNFDSIFGLHFAGKSKVRPGTTQDECGGYDGRGDSTRCCRKWVEEEAATRKFLDGLTMGTLWGIENLNKWEPSQSSSPTPAPA